MKTSTLLVSVSAACAVITAAQITPAVAADQNTAKAAISASVQNQTTNSAVATADNKEDALQAKTNDILKYIVEVKNTGDKELKSIKITDTLPAGVELVSNGAQRTITEEIASIKAGESTTKHIIVKVTAGKDGDIVDNQVCFSATFDGETNEQNSCDNAAVRIGEKPAEQQPAPTAPEAKPEPKPEQKPTESAPSNTTRTDDLPTTGPSDMIAPAAALTTGTLAYIGRLLALKRRDA
jgi:uncharacterized repeat protein (TIGR01451 family)